MRRQPNGDSKLAPNWKMTLDWAITAKLFTFVVLDGRCMVSGAVHEKDGTHVHKTTSKIVLYLSGRQYVDELMAQVRMK